MAKKPKRSPRCWHCQMPRRIEFPSLPRAIIQCPSQGREAFEGCQTTTGSSRRFFPSSFSFLFVLLAVESCWLPTHTRAECQDGVPFECFLKPGSRMLLRLQAEVLAPMSGRFWRHVYTYLRLRCTYLQGSGCLALPCTLSTGTS